MTHAKNYENMFQFVKFTSKNVDFFSGHGVQMYGKLFTVCS